MIQPTYRRGSRVHFVLDRLSRCPVPVDTFRSEMSFTESMARIRESVLDPLQAAKYIEIRDDKYHITVSGIEKIHEMGFVKPRLTPSNKINRMEGFYDGKELQVSVERRGADDHMRHPSRRNGSLYYKDGRVEAV